jgi:hypothetical protein
VEDGTRGGDGVREEGVFRTAGGVSEREVV